MSLYIYIYRYKIKLGVPKLGPSHIIVELYMHICQKQSMPSYVYHQYMHVSFLVICEMDYISSFPNNIDSHGIHVVQVYNS
ncbi:hypothetical protein BDA96_09G080800 [Sorghum bicolor]|uniref:Uncharacterized protein n=2 Tax=Sorghum bicolor TaxID=4558 RepID=A0A921QAE0_SORBI|nr:hypothetical protein BDA96_09G080800 [Sorghum bicolor]KXG21528.1 hypothetical protein SORBI_3009G076600 [Sorghum bicolor]